MRSFKEFMLEMYTVGHTKTYDQNIAQHKANLQSDNEEARKEPAPHKIGVKPSKATSATRKPGETVHPNEAGAVFASAEHAKEAIKRKPSFSVYKLKGNFKRDAFYNKETGFHHLKKDAEILHKVKD
jgi:hypothetical protein